MSSALTQYAVAKRPGAGRGHCTSMGWDSDATQEGHGLASQSDDGEGIGDYRMVFVPAAKHKPGSKRPIWGLGNR